MFDKISTALKNLFTSNTLIQTIYDFEASEAEGFPFLTITPSANSSDYSSTTENRRVYAFVIRLFTERLSGLSNERACENTMREMVDSLLDALDNNWHLPNLETETGYTFCFMRAAPSQWGYAGRENNMRVAEIKVELIFDVDVNLIS